MGTDPDIVNPGVARYTLPLASADALLERVGGKGANLARLARAGYSVPTGFLITTDAYRSFVEDNALRPALDEILKGADSSQLASLEAASTQIRALFATGRLPPGLAAEVRAAYAALGSPPVAVRSSATAEDLPGLSFAGQQDTVLNVIGEAALLEAVVRCWSSLWTARAIRYRARSGLASAGLALAVVVQQMVESEASGVLFTANPLSGKRTETVIDAIFGLGEALVSGQVEPDHYVVETATRHILSRALGAKGLTIHGQAGGGTTTVRAEPGLRQALPDDAIAALTALGEQVQTEYQFPQDIEWAWTGGRLHLLQARPVTSLYPLPAGLTADPLRLFFSFGAVQGVVGPLTPLGQDALKSAIAGVATWLGYPATYDHQRVIWAAGERLWLNLTPLMRNELGRRAVRGMLGFVEPGARQSLPALWDDPRLAPTARHPSFAVVRRLLPRLLRLGRRIAGYLADPAGRRAWANRAVEAYLADVEARAVPVGDWRVRLAERLLIPEEMARVFPFGLLNVATGLAGGLICFNLLNHLTRRLLRAREETPPRAVFELTRSLPDNVTTQMDFELWAVAEAVRANAASARYFETAGSGQLTADYVARRMPAAAQAALDGFMDRYGMRGVAEIDLGRARWREAPDPIMQTLQSYLRLVDAEQAPPAVFKRGEQEAAAAQVELEQLARRSTGGWLTVRLVRFLASRMRALLGARESPKFFLVRVMGHMRAGLLESGRDLMAAGVLSRPDDIFFLQLAELRELTQAASPARDWAALVASRRATFAREDQRRQVPRLFLSDGQAFYEGMKGEAGPNTLMGSPVSPGIAEGLARIVLDPAEAHLAPGEILVCPGTDPAWTPLFLAAGGLVMEVGGMMTHGAVVAREYGLPAVVGVDQATLRIKTGQRLRLNGTTGTIVMLEGGDKEE